MPHYVVTETAESNDFAVYSTVVDGLIIDFMSAAAMRKHLEENGYGSWCESDCPHFAADRMYWNEEHGFWYVTIEDAYYVLPREYWRN